MTVNDLLNSDLSTILALLRRGFDWWTDELRAMIPTRLRATATNQCPTIAVTPDGDIPAPCPGRLCTVLIPESQALIRPISAPSMARADLEAMVALNADRYFPVPAETLVLALDAGQVRNGQRTAGLAAIKRDFAIRVAATVTKGELQPIRIALQSPDGTEDERFDFLPAFRSAGLLPKSRSRAQFWWAICGFMVVANLAIMIWRDVEATNRMEALVSSQNAAVSVSRRISQRIMRNDVILKRADEQRRSGGPVSVIAALSRSLPAEAWVQRLTWEGHNLRITGFRSSGTDVIAALRREPSFAKVRYASGERPAATSNGLPFDLTIELRH
jgi:Tfp pilus assembly protein PilN